ncbi:MAG: hypothetical protein MI919_32450 [Holophagales bacterium]|nr:hypothetical protein [Holophagales bacterium]
MSFEQEHRVEVLPAGAQSAPGLGARLVDALPLLLLASMVGIAVAIEAVWLPPVRGWVKLPPRAPLRPLPLGHSESAAGPGRAGRVISG